MIQEKVATKEAELHATYDERLRNFEERSVLSPSSPCLIADSVLRSERRICNDKSRSPDLNFEIYERQTTPVKRSCSITLNDRIKRRSRD